MDFTFAVRFIAYVLGALLTSIFVNVLRQQLPRRKSEPPLVFHWIPFIGNAVAYGTDPYNFYRACREKHGDVFTFVLLGKSMTVCLGAAGNEFVLNGRVQDLNAEDIYGPLTTPVFGSDIIYDCPNAKLMEQKKFVKFGLTQRALESYVPLIEKEVLDYLDANLKGDSGRLNVSTAMSEITIFTAGRALQGPEVRKKLSASFAELYHDLDMGFRPINFLIPWAPLPQNRRRDAAHLKMQSVYMDLINDRRQAKADKAANNDDKEEEPDMLANLMSCVYKNGQVIPDKEIANMMITLLMGGQHSSSSASAWIMHRLASQPAIAEELYEAQRAAIGPNDDDDDAPQPLTLADLERVPLLTHIVKETLRVHPSIHSLMRKVTRAMAVPGTDYVVGPGRTLVASPVVSHLSAAHFARPEEWDPHRWEDGPASASASTADADADADDAVDYGYGVTSKGTRSPYLPFGAGRHRCIGERFAYLNLATIVLAVVRTLRLRTLDDGAGAGAGAGTVPPTDYSSLFSRPAQSAEIGWERRVPLRTRTTGRLGKGDRIREGGL
ncbi:putative cytochrome P450 14-alpha sterol demethylase [Rosellinia necatrix]|uniref:Putative cytochrome P450 14-alpha sterol demethylase n=1 Tax=Rosellinia necatrix TaxID=77044 RepID=A0A1W2TKW2_ROSNE|nr:putative cytochrome P450 14-alpha sterol demethylase [Rosellinia necatrix]